MSAFVVSFRHIDTILNYAAMCQMSVHLGGENRIDVRGGEQQLGDILFRENLRSVKYRYQHNAHASESHDYSEQYQHSRKPLFVGKAPSAIEFIKLLDCLRYQSCECPDFDQSEASAIIDQLQRQATSRIQGYDNAEWSLDEYCNMPSTASQITSILDL